MDLYEYQAKDLFAAHGVPVLPGRTVRDAEEAAAAAAELGGTVVVKAQVKTGGRGKAGGVKLAIVAGGDPGEGRGDPRDGHQGPHRPPGADHRGRRTSPRSTTSPSCSTGATAPSWRCARPRAAWRSSSWPSSGPEALARIPVDAITGVDAAKAARDRRRREDPGGGGRPGRRRDREAVGDLRRRGRHAGRGEPAGPRPARQGRRARRQGDPGRQRRLPPPRARRPGRRAHREPARGQGQGEEPELRQARGRAGRDHRQRRRAW